MKNSGQWRPTKFKLGRHGLRASRNTADVGRGSRFSADLAVNEYERIIRTHAAGRLIDIGCGHVPLYEVYRDLVSDNVCIDWEHTLHKNSYLDQTVDLNGKWPFEDSSFDTALLTDVLEHIAEPVNVMCEIARVRRPGGKLLLGVPFFYWLHEEPHDYYRYTEHALRRFCKLSGFQVVEVTPFGGLPEVLLDATSKGIEMLPRFLAASLRPFHSAAILLCGCIPGRKGWSRWLFPLGYVLVAEKIQTEISP